MLRTFLAGVLLVAPVHATGIDQEAASSKAEEVADSSQTVPTAPQTTAATETNTPPQKVGKARSLYRAWRSMTDREESSEPNWLSPLATTSGRIKDEFRYDIGTQTVTGGSVASFGGNKGLEFIAALRVQLLLGIPPYTDHSTPSPSNGFGDLPLMLKFRIAAANASKGDYLVTFLLSATAPTAARPKGAGEAVLTPTLALGKGWRQFDAQTTLGVNLPAAETQRLGRQILWNTTFQYRADWKLWPELEANSTFYEQGSNAGKTQTLLTPGLGFGRVHLFGGLRFSIAAGEQIAVTHFHTYDHHWLLSMRFPF